MIGGGDKMSRMRKDVNLAGFILKNIIILQIVNLNRKTDLYLYLPLKIYRYARGKADCRIYSVSYFVLDEEKKKMFVLVIKPPLNYSDTSPIQGWDFPLGNGQKYLEVVAWEDLGGVGRGGE